MFPESLEDGTMKELNKLLPGSDEPRVNEDDHSYELHYVEDIMPSEARGGHNAAGEAYDEDDSPHGAQQGVQCRQS